MKGNAPDHYLVIIVATLLTFTKSTMFTPDFLKKRAEFISSNSKYSSLFSEEQLAQLHEPPNAPESSQLKKDDDANEIPLYFLINATGNIMLASTTPKQDEIDPDVRKLFQKTQVFFGAIAAALTKKGKDFNDYEALKAAILGLGFFFQIDSEERIFQYSSRELTLNTAIVQDVVGSIGGIGTSLRIAQRIVESIGSQIKVANAQSESSKKIAHLMFVCENLLGLPVVTSSILYIDSKEGQEVSQTNCSDYTQTTIKFRYNRENFLFVDPTLIEQFSAGFAASHEYQDLIDRIAELIPA